MNYDKKMKSIIKKKKKEAEKSKYGPYNDASKNSALAKALRAKKVMDYSNKTSSPSDKKYGRKK
jgi:hypothetical protein